MSEEFQRISKDFKVLSVAEKKGDLDFGHLGDIGRQSLNLLKANLTKSVDQGQVTIAGVTKHYELRSFGKNISRPIRKDLFISDPAEFAQCWQELRTNLEKQRWVLEHSCLDKTLYTAIMAFAVGYDLYMPTSRKTPGTYFELLIGTILGGLTGLRRGKQIDLPDTDYKVPTDIVLYGAAGKPSLVIPTKITTRERIVQAWAHQRILADVYGDRYRSILVCVSELQRDENRGVNEICVPGQVKGFQKHLAQMSGMYYLDPPASYTTEEFLKIIPVKPLSALLQGDLKKLLEID